MTAPRIDTPVVDLDSHVYEPRAIWDHYVPEPERALARAAFFHDIDDTGQRLTVLNGATATELSRQAIIRHAVWRPGCTAEDIGALDPRAFSGITPGAWDAEARLADMDTMGVDRAVIFPTLFLEYLPLVADPFAAAVLARAYNDWILDFCRADETRLLPVAMLPLQNVMLARRELARIVDLGVRRVAMRPMWYPVRTPPARGLEAQMRLAMELIIGHSPHASPGTAGPFVLSSHFAPVWDHLDELGCTVFVHASEGSTNPEGTCTGSYAERVARPLTIGHNVAEAVGYLQDTGVFVIAALFQGFFEDHATLPIVLTHSTVGLLPLVAEKVESYLWLVGSGSPVVVPYDRAASKEPQEVLDAHPLLAVFPGWETIVGRLPDDFATKGAWGSRYPHHDATDPASTIAMLRSHGATDEHVACFLGGNARALLDGVLSATG